MARKIIILDRVNLPSDQDYRVAFWLSVPVSRRTFYADATKASVVIGAAAQEVSAIQSGAVVEVIETLSQTEKLPVGQVMAALEKRHAELQPALTDRNPWQRYGSSWDGSAWSPVTVA